MCPICRTNPATEDEILEAAYCACERTVITSYNVTFWAALPGDGRGKYLTVDHYGLWMCDRSGERVRVLEANRTAALQAAVDEALAQEVLEA